MAGEEAVMGLKLVPMETDAQRAYFWASVRARGGKWPYDPAPGWKTAEERRALVARARDRVAEMVGFELAKPDAEVRIIVTEEEPDAFAGCLAWRPGFILHAFVSPELQEQGLMKWALVSTLGHVLDGKHHGHDEPVMALDMRPLAPLPVLVWSATASRIAAKGWRIYPAIPYAKETP